jgi:Tol biopolymer transport system component
MLNTSRSLTAWIATPLLVLILLSACEGAALEELEIPQVPDSDLNRLTEPKSGKIAFIGGDGNIYITDQGGVDTIALTDDAEIVDQSQFFAYFQPVWSYDSERLAFLSIRSESESGVTDLSLYVASADGETVEVVYKPNIAETMTYLGWNPQDSAITLLSQVSQTSFALRRIDLAEGAATPIDSGSPLFWDWNPISDGILVHIGSSPQDRFSYLDFGDEGIKESVFDVPTTAFRAPTIAPDGSRFGLVVLDAENGDSVLYLANFDGVIRTEVARADGDINFTWSPDGKRIAYVVTRSAAEDPDNPFGGLYVLNLEDPAKNIALPDEPTVAAFWSPNSKRLAYFTVDTEREGDTVAVHMMNANTGSAQRIQRFTPSRDFLQTLSLFDQYSHSYSIWSPNSRSLTITGSIADSGLAVWVLNAGGGIEPRPLAPGYIGYWSWQ